MTPVLGKRPECGPKMGDINGGGTYVGWHGEVTSMGTDVLYTAVQKLRATGSLLLLTLFGTF